MWMSTSVVLLSIRDRLRQPEKLKEDSAWDHGKVLAGEAEVCTADWFGCVLPRAKGGAACGGSQRRAFFGDLLLPALYACGDTFELVLAQDKV